MDEIEAARHCMNTLEAVSKYFDVECAHGDADEALLQFLRDIGHHDIAQKFEEIRTQKGFWYA
jgi:hypothetical protein